MPLSANNICGPIILDFSNIYDDLFEETLKQGRRLCYYASCFKLATVVPAASPNFASLLRLPWLCPRVAPPADPYRWTVWAWQRKAYRPKPFVGAAVKIDGMVASLWCLSTWYGRGNNRPRKRPDWCEDGLEGGGLIVDGMKNLHQEESEKQNWTLFLHQVCL